MNAKIAVSTFLVDVFPKPLIFSKEYCLALVTDGKYGESPSEPFPIFFRLMSSVTSSESLVGMRFRRNFGYCVNISSLKTLRHDTLGEVSQVLSSISNFGKNDLCVFSCSWIPVVFCFYGLKCSKNRSGVNIGNYEYLRFILLLVLTLHINSESLEISSEIIDGDWQHLCCMSRFRRATVWLNVTDFLVLIIVDRLGELYAQGELNPLYFYDGDA